MTRLNPYPCILLSGFLLLFLPLRLTTAASCSMWSSRAGLAPTFQWACPSLPCKPLGCSLDVPHTSTE